MKLLLSVEDAANFAAIAQQLLTTGGCLVTSNDKPEMRQKVSLQICVGDVSSPQVEAEVVYLGPDEQSPYCVGLALLGQWQAWLQEFSTACASHTGWNQRWGSDSENLQHQINQLSINDKMRLAMKGGKDERKLILRDSKSYAVHKYLLQNPRLTQDEVVQITRLPNATTDMLVAIAANKEWMNNQAVRLAVAKNARTPMAIARKLLPLLTDQELTQIAKGEATRGDMVRECKALLKRRGRLTA